MNGLGELLRQRRFLPLFITQFLGALNDNAIKNAMVVLLTFQAASWTTLTPGLLANLAAGIFILPFFLFSATAGQLADKYDKAKLARLVKLLEIFIVLVAGVGFMARHIEILFAALFLLGLHSTLFGPVKYAILPQHLHADELVSGNALVEAGTFIAILGGTLCGGLLAAVPGATVWITLSGLLIAGGGYCAAHFIPAAVPPAPTLRVSRNPLAATWRNLSVARKNREVLIAIVGISWFWLYGALFLAQFPAYAKNTLGGDETVVTLLLATFIIGIGSGSLLCATFVRRHPQRGLALVLPGCLGLTVFALDVAFASPMAQTNDTALSALAILHAPGIWRMLADFALLGLCGGLFSVPLYTWLQQSSEVDQRARMIAANNIVNALFMVVGSLGAAAALSAGLSIPALFGYAALGNALIGVVLYRHVVELRWRNADG
jgi:MFS family permease